VGDRRGRDRRGAAKGHGAGTDLGRVTTAGLRRAWWLRSSSGSRSRWRRSSLRTSGRPRRPYGTGQYRVAVGQARVSLSAHIAKKAGSSLTERELVAQVFSPNQLGSNQVRLHLPGDKSTKTWKSRQEGTPPPGAGRLCWDQERGHAQRERVVRAGRPGAGEGPRIALKLRNCAVTINRLPTILRFGHHRRKISPGSHVSGVWTEAPQAASGARA
jgi:hypothetical protein